LSDHSIIKLEQSRVAGTRRLREVPLEREPAPTGDSPGGNSSPGPEGDRRQYAERAADLLRQAEDRADALQAEAKKEAERLRERAQRAGYETGLERGRKDAAGELAQVSDDLRADWEAACDRVESRVESLGDRMIDIIVQVCEEVLGREMADADVVAELVKKCLGRFSDISDITLILSPSDVSEILDRRPDLEHEIPPRTELLITTDAALAPGEFRIRGDEGVFEGTVSDIAASLRRHLERTLMGEADDA